MRVKKCPALVCSRRRARNRRCSSVVHQSPRRSYHTPIEQATRFLTTALDAEASFLDLVVLVPLGEREAARLTTRAHMLATLTQALRADLEAIAIGRTA